MFFVFVLVMDVNEVIFVVAVVFLRSVVQETTTAGRTGF